MRDTIFIIFISTILILILKYSGYNNPDKVKNDNKIKLTESIDFNYDKKYPKKF